MSSTVDETTAAALRAELVHADPAVRPALARALELAEGTRLREQAMETTNEGVIIIDVRVPGGAVIYANAGFERLTGYAREDFMGRNCALLLGPGTDGNEVERLRGAVQSGELFSTELLNYRKDGTPFWNRLSLTPLRNDHGEVTHYIGIQSDVTAQMEATREVKAALELLEATNRRLTAANKRMKADLDAAARVQQAMLPERLPEANGYGFAWKYLPCEALAGDTLNIFKLDERHVGLYLLDVTGHGTAAALMAVAVSRMLSPNPNASSLLWQHCGHQLCIVPPSEVAVQLNDLYRWEPETGQFFTLVYGVLDTVHNRLDYVTAGHPGPLSMHKDGRTEQAPTKGLPIGLSDEPYAPQTLLLEPGDRFVLYSDGISDVHNQQRELFGRDRVVAALTGARNLPIANSLESLVNTAESWRAEKRFQDDVSLLAIERHA